MNYQEAKQIKAKIEDDFEKACDALRQYPRLANGLTPDSAKTDQWMADKAARDGAFKTLCAFNSFFVKRYEREYKEERRADARRAVE